MRRGPYALALVGGLLLLPFISADHFQWSRAPPVVAFDHVGGSSGPNGSMSAEISGVTCHDATTVQGRFEGGAWGTMWRSGPDQPCRWIGRFEIPAGRLVQFRVRLPDDGGTRFALSCMFTHPGGEERCDALEPFVGLAFPVAGNEWWVEARAQGNKEIRAVDARADGGGWVALERTSWGTWARSFHVPEGSLVEFRLSSPHAETLFGDLCYRWPSREMVPDPGGSGPTPSFRFLHPRGNEWWVQTNVCGWMPIGNVSARVVEGSADWTPLDLKPWGDWAAPMRVTPGLHVQFQACAPERDPRCDVSEPVRWPPS